MGTQPWLKSGVVMVWGLVLAGCQTPPPRMASNTPPAPGFARQTQQAAPQFPTTATNQGPGQFPSTAGLGSAGVNPAGNLGPAPRTANSGIQQTGAIMNPSSVPG